MSTADQSSIKPPSATQSVMPIRTFDITVIGGGIAGLAFTLNLPGEYSVALITKGALGESNTRYA